MLFDAEALHSFVRVLNLTDGPFHLHKDQLLGMASKVEVCGLVPSLQAIGVGSDPDVVVGTVAPRVTQDSKRM